MKMADTEKNGIRDPNDFIGEISESRHKNDDSAWRHYISNMVVTHHGISTLANTHLSEIWFCELKRFAE
ncbi:unnamed protein product [Notodromas monacha]|uniref:Uncharacterized protein n=1 Tax=Notodromas monacha TaxID=399045 RepID=A0A7R9BCD4_9CRUS|nr:unnamed protein product [Notodromas monacha]CAG0912639.1 unnamed protein product [Notodromas monacha]